MTLIEQINTGIKEAMRSKNELRLNTLRMLKSKILAVDARATLSDGDVIKLFKTYLGNLQEALDHAQTANRSEIAETLRCEIAIVQEFLPKSLSPEETRKLVMQAIATSGAKSKKEMGLVMKTLMQLNSAIDGKLASELVRQLLND